MSRRYSAFLVRLWRREDGSERIEIEHIQAGTRGVVASRAAAIAWLSDHADDAATADESGVRAGQGTARGAASSGGEDRAR